MTIKRIATLLLAMMIAFSMTAWAETEAFRNGKVIEVVGGALVTRSNYQMPVYAQMVIQSGDELTTAADGQVVLCLDEDKYLILEPETKAVFELEGAPQRGMIRIRLLAGAIYSEIENPLLDGDAYEIHTTDGVMAVRGTNFRASQGVDEENQQRRTDVQLFFGELEVSTSGEQPQEETLSDGEEISITTPLDESGNPAGEPELGQKQPLNMDDLPEQYDQDKLKAPEALFGQNGEAGAAICPACQQEMITEKDHAPVASQSKYCREQHYRCTGTMHYCDPQRDYNADKAGLQGGCGDKHGCDSSNAHTLCRMCGDMWCDYSNGGHETPCGNAYHRPCQINQTGYYRKSAHQECPYGCGENLCSRKSHGTGEGQCSYVEIRCSFCGTAGIQHGEASCGRHCVAQSGTHEKCGGCGGWLCEGSHERLTCGHCQQSTGTHQLCEYCRNWLCRTPNVSHGTGAGQCGYAAPISCGFCGTAGIRHGEASCGRHCVAQSGKHEKCGGCGGWLCVGAHVSLTCGHCQQSSGTHQRCGYCEDWLCLTPNVSHGTGEGQCGYFEPIPCFGCGEVGANHNVQFCNTHCEAQTGDHTKCAYCNYFLCLTTDVTHGDGVCNSDIP